MKPSWLVLVLTVGGLFVFLYLMSLVGNHISG